MVSFWSFVLFILNVVTVMQQHLEMLLFTEPDCSKKNSNRWEIGQITEPSCRKLSHERVALIAGRQAYYIEGNGRWREKTAFCKHGTQGSSTKLEGWPCATKIYCHVKSTWHPFHLWKCATRYYHGANRGYSVPTIKSRMRKRSKKCASGKLQEIAQPP